MKPSRFFVGQTQTPVLIVDDIGESVANILSIAAALGPFPPATNNYPGVRRILSTDDSTAWCYLTALLECASPYLAGAFNLDRFDLLEASFSMVSMQPTELKPVQRIPHFDSVDPDFFAIIHYVSACSGTAFYRHVQTGVETVSLHNIDHLVFQMRNDAKSVSAQYFGDSNETFEKIGEVDGVPGRLVAYPGRLLHSGIIPKHCQLSVIPSEGRLTTNIFIRGHFSQNWPESERPT